MNLKQLALILAAVFAVPVFGIGGRLEAQSGQLKDEPTPINRGEMTPVQREHSKLYKTKALGRKITRQTEPEVTIYMGSDFGRAGADPRTPEERLRQNICAADLVIVGTVKSKASQLTPEEDFIFTGYTMTIEDVLKNDITAPVRKPGSILLSGPGGAVRLDGKTLAVVDRDEPPLRRDIKYLLFLSRIPETQGYVAKAGSLSFDGDGKNRVLSQEFRYWDFMDKPVPQILAAVKSASAQRCSSAHVWNRAPLDSEPLHVGSDKIDWLRTEAKPPGIGGYRDGEAEPHRTSRRRSRQNVNCSSSTNFDYTDSSSPRTRSAATGF